MKEVKYYWIRWILFIPASLIGFFLIAFVASSMYNQRDVEGHYSITSLGSSILGVALGTYFSIYISSWILVNHKAISTLVIMIIMFIVAVSVFIYGFIQNGIELVPTLSCLGQCIAAVIGRIHSVKDDF